MGKAVSVSVGGRALRSVIWSLCLLMAVVLPANAWARDNPLPGVAADGTQAAALPPSALPGEVRTGRWVLGQAQASTTADEPVFEIGSISKVFTGLLLAQAVQTGTLSLDDRLDQRLNGLRFATTDTAAITLRQLVTHTACLPRIPDRLRQPPNPDNPYASYDRSLLWQDLAGLHLTQAPPCRARYSNFGFAVLGELLAQHFGQSWAQLVHQSITGPLGMADTTLVLHASQRRRLTPGFRGPQPTMAWTMSAFAAAGGLHASVPDLLKLGSALMQGKAGPLGEAAVLATTPLASFGKDQIGYAWIIRTRATDGGQLWFHDGKTAGYRALMVMTPSQGELQVTLAANSQARLPPIQPRAAATNSLNR